MSSASRIYKITKTLIVSQLRASRSQSGKARFWERPAFILFIDVIALLLSAFTVYELVSLILSTVEFPIVSIAQQVLSFVPIFGLALVLIAGMMFELNTSSRFASSDLINWLPISKWEYVSASALSVSYIYSIYLCIAAGIGLALSIQTNLLLAWGVSFALSIISLVTGGILIEILRASINRVYSALSKKASRATLVVRLVLTILLIVAFQAVFYPNLLLGIMSEFVGALNASFFIPLVWPSLAILAIVVGDVARALIFGGLTLVFALCLFFIAVAVRSRYWSPTPVTITFKSGKEYTPHYGRLRAFGFSNVESSLVSKDLKGYVRRKELIAFLTMPFVFAAILVIQRFAIYSDSTIYSGSEISILASWFAGFAALFVSASSIGTESKSFLNLYMFPISPKELIRAKAVSSLVISVMGAIVISVVAAIVFNPTLEFFLGVVVVTLLVSVQSVFIGLCFATRDSDFAERPRPRYITTMGMLKVMLVGTGALILTSIPYLLQVLSPVFLSLMVSVALFAVITFVAYRYSVKGALTLMEELKT